MEEASQHRGNSRTSNYTNTEGFPVYLHLISSATPRTLASWDRSKEETTTEKTEPRKLGEVRFEDMFW